MGCPEIILLDTCAIIWDALDPGKLSPDAKNAIEFNEEELIICDISIWEISMLIKRKRLVVNDPADRLIVATSILANAPVVTADNNLRSATVLETIW